jgi:glycosyltransferase involved in cell wall biosynthesis
MNQMNILYLTNHLNIGGITSYVLTLATGLKKRGHKVFVASTGGGLLAKFTDSGIFYIAVPMNTKSEISPKIIASAFKLLSCIRQNDIDIIHSNSRTTQVLGCLLDKLTGKAHIHTCHGFFKRRLSRRLFGCWGREIIAISEQVKAHLKQDFGIREEIIRVINNGIDAQKFQIQNHKSQTEIKRMFGLGEGPVVGIVARLSDVKGHVYLIEAMKTVLERIPDAQLLIIGEGKMKQKLVNLSIGLGIDKNVFFIPRTENTPEALSVMDVFVLPSLKEGLGLSLMEAMASGLAVIGSDIGGIRSLIDNSRNGFLVRPADSKGLACAITDLLQSPGKRRAVGEQARIFISQNFPQEKMVSETERMYLECLNVKI